jgi:amino acid transporter
MADHPYDVDAEQLKALGYTSHYERSMSLWENFALGFTYLSPVVGVYSVFALGMVAAGPPMIWWYLIAALGQFVVCLIFCEVVSQFPISGGLYPWARRLVGKRWAWMAGWIYGWALFTSIAAVAAGAAPFIAPLLGFTATPDATAGIAIAIVAASTLINLAGTKTLSRVAMFGFVCEILGAIAVGGYLLLFHRHQPIGIVFEHAGATKGGNYARAFMAAAVVGLFTCYGFEACGDVAEETPDPGLGIPRAMRSTIYIGMAASVFVCLALILSVPDMAKVVDGEIADPIEAILMTAFGLAGARLVVVVVMVSFVSCILSLQAAASRLVHAYARDQMIVGSQWLSGLSAKTLVPSRALLLSGLIAATILVLGRFFQDAVGAIVSFAVIGIYAAFQMVVAGALWARLKGWRPGGQFVLGRWSLPLNVLGLIWGIAAIADMVWPRTPDQLWFVNYAMLLTFGGVVIAGLACMVIFRPYDKGAAPAGDAWTLGKPSRRELS